MWLQRKKSQGRKREQIKNKMKIKIRNLFPLFLGILPNLIPAVTASSLPTLSSTTATSTTSLKLGAYSTIPQLPAFSTSVALELLQ
jgi:hypothetical protein